MILSIYSYLKVHLLVNAQSSATVLLAHNLISFFL